MNSELLEKFEKRAAKVNSWYSAASPKWYSRLKRFSGSPAHYLKYFVYQFSKKGPIFIRARTFLGTKFYCYLPDYFWTWCCGILGDPSERILTRFLIKNIREGDVFLDVGSNCGFYAVLAGVLTGEKGSVHAFEPTQNIFKMLEKNTKGFKNVFLVDAAISDKSGEAEFFLNPLYTVANSLVIKPAAAYTTAKVKVTTLDNYCYAHNVKPTFIKLDIEGAEMAAVLGGQRILTETSPIISLEILDQPSGADFSAAEKLVGLGYVPHKLLPNAQLEKISLPEIVSLYGSGKNDFYNFIFKKS